MVAVEMRTRKAIEIEICDCEQQFLFFQKYNRLSDARLERLKIVDLELELSVIGDEEDAERMGFCYE